HFFVIYQQHSGRRSVAGEPIENVEQAWVIDRLPQVGVGAEMERLALLAGRRGNNDRNVAGRFALPQAQYQSPGLVAEQHYVEQNRSRLHAFECTASGGDGAGHDGLIPCTAKQPLYREAVGEIVVHDEDRYAGGVDRPFFLRRSTASAARYFRGTVTEKTEPCPGAL